MRLTAKKVQRMEKKKKKIAAFLEIAKLNDHDRAKAAIDNNRRNHEPMDVEDCLSEPSTPEGPCRKRPKKNINMQHGDSNEKNNDDQSFEDRDSEDKDMEEIDLGESANNNPNKCSEVEVTVEDKRCSSVSDAPNVKVRKNKSSVSDVDLKNEYRERRSRSKNIPSLRLKTVGEFASLSMKEKKRTPLLISDIQHILMYALLGQQAPVWPLRWCVLDKYNRISHIVVLLIEGISLYDFASHSSSLPFLKSTFETQLEVIMPSSYNGSLVEELISVPLTEIHKERLIQQYGSLEAAVRASGDVNLALRAFFPIDVSDEENVSLPSSDSFCRTKLLLSVPQMIEQNYPVPVKGEMKDRYSRFILTKDSYKRVTSTSPMFGLDCEMCRTTSGELEVTRISIVNEKLEVVYESFVKPHNRITDYLTRYSGITKQTLADIKVRLEDVQEDLRRILPPDAILVGQSLNADLQSLKMMHPYVIDTSCIYNITGERHRKSKLSMLSHKFLLEDIQNGSNGHCSVEDSCACIKLTKLKLANGLDYGDAVLVGRRDAETKRLKRLTSEQVQLDESYATSIFSHAQRVQKEAAVISIAERNSEYKKCISNASRDDESAVENVKRRIKCVEEVSNEAVVERTCQVAMEQHFTLSHVVCPEAEEQGAATMIELDRWCEQLWQSTAVHGLLLVLLGGRGKANGACFATVKKKARVQACE